MATTSWKLSSLSLLLLTACSFRTEEIIQITPPTKAEIEALRHNIQTGEPTETPQQFQSTNEPCAAPDFFAKNVEGRIQVPEDYSKPQGRQIQVYYYGRIQAGKEPVVFFNGGPASDSHSSSQTLEDFLRVPQAQKLSFIYIDQRGTGCSDPFPSEPTPESIERLAHYTSAEIVKDAEAIREKVLGPQKSWKIFGQSYGGLIVHRYALLAPQFIEGAYSHGFSLMSDKIQWLKLRIQSQKRVGEVYFKSYPVDREILAKVKSQIPEDLCFTDQKNKVCGRKITDALTMYLGFSNSWGSLHQTLTRLLSANGTLLRPALEKYVKDYVFGLYVSSGLAVQVISKLEVNGGFSDAQACRLAQELLKAEGESPESWPFNECRLAAGVENAVLEKLLEAVKSDFQMKPADLTKALSQNPTLPFYLYAGENDVFVPVESFEEEVKTLGSQVTYRQFPISGHEGFYTEKQVWSDILGLH